MANQKGIAAGIIGIGGIFVWSGLNNKKITQTLQDLIRGTKPVPGPGAVQAAVTSVPAGSGVAASAAADAMKYQGAGYVWGGKPIDGIGHWDCSSFANWVYGHDLGLAIPAFPAGTYTGATHGPTTLYWLAWNGAVTVGHDGNVAQPGDLAVWQTHMGICTGPNTMISAENPKDGTRESAINGFIPEFLSIRRYKAA